MRRVFMKESLSPTYRQWFELLSGTWSGFLLKDQNSMEGSPNGLMEKILLPSKQVYVYVKLVWTFFPKWPADILETLLWESHSRWRWGGSSWLGMDPVIALLFPFHSSMSTFLDVSCITIGPDDYWQGRYCWYSRNSLHPHFHFILTSFNTL